MKKSLILIGALCALHTFPSFASAGDGTRGGGETVDVNGYPELRDLVDQSVCRWQTGADEYAQAPGIGAVLDRLARVDWYIAATIKREILFLNYCLTGQLVRVNTRDPRHENVVVAYELPTQQVAIRLNNDVYINDAVRRSLQPESQGWLAVHEAAHSFIDWGTARRNHKLRSLVRSLSDAANGNIGISALHLAVRQNDAHLPTTVARLRPFRAQVTFLLEGYEGKKTILANQADPAAFIASIDRIPADALVEYQRELLDVDQVDQIVETALAQDDVNGLAILIRSRSIARRVLGQVYASHEADLQPNIAAWLATQTGLQQLVTLSLESLAEKTPVVRQGRIVAPGFEAMALNGSATTPFTALETLAATGFERAAPEMIAYFGLVRGYLIDGDVSSAAAITVGHPIFRRAFGVQDFIAQVNALEGVSAQEKAMAVRKARVLGTSFWRAVAAWMLQSGVERDVWDEFMSSNINLGYEF